MAATISVANAQVGPSCCEGPQPAFVVQPPCCQTPDVLKAIASRPMEESPEDFLQWFRKREGQIDPYKRSDDYIALSAACNAGCSSRYEAALAVLSHQVLPLAITSGGMVRYKRDSRAPYPAPEPRRTSRQPERPRGNAQSTAPILSFAVASDFVNRLMAWRGPPDQFPKWTRDQLAAYKDDELGDLSTYLAGSCPPNRQCGPNLTMARQAIDGMLKERQLKQERARAEGLRSETELNESKGRWIAFVSALISAVVAGVIAIIGNVLTGRVQVRERSEMVALMHAALVGRPRINSRPLRTRRYKS